MTLTQRPCLYQTSFPDDVIPVSRYLHEVSTVWPFHREKHGAQRGQGAFCLTSECVCSVAQLCPHLCSPMDCSQPGSSVHGILQAIRQEWVAYRTINRFIFVVLCCLSTLNFKWSIHFAINPIKFYYIIFFFIF